MITLDDLTEPPPAVSAADWNSEGVVVMPGFFDALFDLAAYRQEWSQCHDWAGHDRAGRIIARRPNGWRDATPYMRHDALRALCCNDRLAALLASLTGEPMGVHLNLTGWVTTERDWHQDSYLNPPHVGDSYAAIWLALGDIDERSGPFQYVPGSHRWPQVTQRRIAAHVDLNDPYWPKQSETLLTPLFEQMIRERRAEVVTYLPRAGDLLVWHGRLLHRGSRAAVKHMERRALIAHYSGIDHRRDMPRAVQHEAGGWYFPIEARQPA